MKRLLLLVASLIVLALLCVGAVWWGSGCKAVEKKVDDQEFKLVKIGSGWLISAPSGFSSTSAYLTFFNGMLGKRTSRDPDGREFYKLARHCGGGEKTAAWAWAKNIRPDGTFAPRPKPQPSGLGHLGGQWVIVSAAVVVVMLAVAVANRRRLATVS